MVQDISLAIRRELEGLVYLGPLRQKPQRDYPWNKGQPGIIEPDGKQAIDVLLASALLQGPDRNRIIKEVSRWLKRMDLADQLQVRQVGRSTRYEVVIDSQSVAANLRDVGIGISQVLPVLTVAFFAPPGSTVILEEPEIHLHPLAQSVLAELFVEASREQHLLLDQCLSGTRGWPGPTMWRARLPACKLCFGRQQRGYLPWRGVAQPGNWGMRKAQNSCQTGATGQLQGLPKVAGDSALCRPSRRWATGCQYKTR
jgi:hypothetical protein